MNLIKIVKAASIVFGRETQPHRTHFIADKEFPIKGEFSSQITDTKGKSRQSFISEIVFHKVDEEINNCVIIKRWYDRGL